MLPTLLPNDAMVMIDECHATGFMGKTGSGTHEYHQVMDKIDIITGERMEKP